MIEMEGIIGYITIICYGGGVLGVGVGGGASFFEDVPLGELPLATAVFAVVCVTSLGRQLTPLGVESWQWFDGKTSFGHQFSLEKTEGLATFVLCLCRFHHHLHCDTYDHRYRLFWHLLSPSGGHSRIHLSVPLANAEVKLVLSLCVCVCARVRACVWCGGGSSGVFSRTYCISTAILLLLLRGLYVFEIYHDFRRLII